MRAGPGPDATTDDLARWGGSGVIVVTAHVGLALFLLAQARPAAPVAEPPEPILIELEATAPAAFAPSLPPPAAAEFERPPEPPEPEPEQIEEPVSEDVVLEPQTIETPVEGIEAPDAPAVEARLPRQRPDIVPKPERRVQVTRAEPKTERIPKKARKPPPEKRGAPAAAARRAQAESVPVAGARSGRASVSPDRWRSQVVRHLERRKRYPRNAERQGLRGTVRVSFTIYPSGNITGHRITGSSGHPELDRAVEEMIGRASPVPAPPPDLYRPGLSLAVPIRFSSR